MPNRPPNTDSVINKYSGTTILVTEPNSGSGSSRKHPAYGPKQYHSKVIPAPPFTDIFYSKTVKNMSLPHIITHKSVNPPDQLIYNEERFNVEFSIDPTSINHD
ncbi:MAG: hypothetical protein RMJ51_00940 [Candidatus Calescibacterium sp.]|nr:hypothetical protein [Candidatus Calescibacterium sp.]MDW8194798.1 hypothetical protein [Candidatus Calescibacterium sp.]